jgi:hypothetical protein
MASTSGDGEKLKARAQKTRARLSCAVELTVIIFEVRPSDAAREALGAGSLVPAEFDAAAIEPMENNPVFVDYV